MWGLLRPLMVSWKQLYVILAAKIWTDISFAILQQKKGSFLTPSLSYRGWMCRGLESQSNFFHGLLVQRNHAEESWEDSRGRHEARRHVGEFVFRRGQDENRFRPLSQLDPVDPRHPVSVADVVDVETGKDLVEEVERGDGADLPAQTAQNQKLAFLFRMEKKKQIRLFFSLSRLILSHSYAKQRSFSSDEIIAARYNCGTNEKSMLNRLKAERKSFSKWW